MRHSEAAQQKFAKLSAAGHLAVCTIIVGELLYSARNADEFLRQWAEYETLHLMDTGPDCERRALHVMRPLAMRGQHRGVSVPDLLIAATAEMRGAILLHYDSDFERVAEVTGQPHEWIVPRGERHGRADP